MIQDHPLFLPPANQFIKLWRYIDLSKFIDVLLRSKIFFPRAKYLGDPFENSTTKATKASWDYIKQNKDNDPKLVAWKDMPSKVFEGLMQAISKSTKDGLDEMLVSCWHMNDFESAAMWKLYSKSEESICMVTDYSTLKNALPPYCFLGSVRYVDYETYVMDTLNGLSYITHKRKSFEHEREIRAVIWTQQLKALVDNPASYSAKYDISEVSEVFRGIDKYGTYVPIDINKVIKTIYVNPSASLPFYETVKEIVHRLGYTFPVKNSSISGDPIY